MKKFNAWIRLRVRYLNNRFAAEQVKRKRIFISSAVLRTFFLRLEFSGSNRLCHTACMNPANSLTLFLCGDVMTGRGIDQIMPHSSDPRLFEPYVSHAREYVELAERVNGPIPTRVDPGYIWGNALAEFRRVRPDLRIINLETSITTSNDAWPGKGIHYRMHPKNISCLQAAEIDCCVLANNHVLDWGYSGLEQTIEALRAVRIATAGAGPNHAAAAAPAALDVAGKRRVLVYSFAMQSSGVPASWAAVENRWGVNLLPDLSAASLDRIARRIQTQKRPGDLVIASIHWGGNWGYHIPGEHTHLAHYLIDNSGMDIVHGHSSHHPLAIEVYKHKPILYGCGDFLNDYEGISGYEQFRGDLTLMYFVRMNLVTGRLDRLEMVPCQIKQFRVTRASAEDTRWLLRILSNECAKFQLDVILNDDQNLLLNFQEGK